MQRRILTILLAVFLAWHFGPLLLDGMISSGPIWAELISILTPVNLTGRGIAFYVQFFIGVVIFWFLIKLASGLMSFALPRSQRYGTTKILRRIQGLVLEFLIVLTCFLVITLAVTLFTNGWEGTDAYAYVAVIQDLGALLAAAAIAVYLFTQRMIKSLIVSVYTTFLLTFLELGRFGEGGSARFAGLVEEWALRYDVSRHEQDGTLFVGRSLYDRTLHIGINDDRHMLTLAGSRGGKGKSAIIPNLLLWKGSALIVDPKGTNALVTAKRRQDMGQKIYVIDPFETLGKDFYHRLGKDGPDKFNPLSGLDTQALTIREDLAVLSDAVIVADTHNRDPHWDDGARTVNSGLTAHLITAPEYQDSQNLPKLRDLLALNANEQDALWASMSLNRQAGDWARDAASRVVRGINTDEIQNILSNVDKHTEWLGSEGIKNVLSVSGQNGESKSIFAELRETPTTIYLVVPPKFLDIHRRFLRLFINLALNEMTKGKKRDTKVLMLLDEFQQLGKMPEIVKAYRLLAGYNFVVWIFAQDWAGLTELYGSDANSFLSSSRAIQVFSLNDAQSLELISKSIGARSRSGWTNPNLLQSVSLRTPDEVSKEISRESNKQYVLRSGAAPLILERVSYYEDVTSWLAKLLGPQQRFWRPGSNLQSSGRNLLGNSKLRLLNLLYPFRELYDRDPDYNEGLNFAERE